MSAYLKAHRKIILLGCATVSLVLVVIGEILCPNTAGKLAPIGWTISTICWIWSDV